MAPLSSQEASRRRQRGLEVAARISAADPVLHIATLCTFDTDLLPPFLVEALDRAGLAAVISAGLFGQIAQQALDPASALYQNPPDIVLLIPAADDLLESFFQRPLALRPEDIDALVDDQVLQVRLTATALLERLPAASIYLVVMDALQAPLEHLLDPLDAARGQGAVDRLLAGLRALSGLSPRLVIVDWAWQTRRSGLDSYIDPRLWYLARMRLNPPGLAALADLVAVHVAAYRGLTRKVAIVDLDNTLWGGVVGEDGLAGLELGGDGQGLAFQEFQRELLRLHDIGIVLAVCSKNNPADAWEVFDHHEGMILRREHLASARINWQDKATNLREIAEELSLGLDSFVFLDDNPVEREWVRTALPEVLTPDLPADVVLRPGFLRELPAFRRLHLTAEDLGRAESYKAEARRRNLREEAGSLQDFLASLEQEITIQPVHAGTMARAAQMCQRTNQFNLTTHRYTVADLEHLLADPAVEAYTVAVRDRFGDSGITGLAILRLSADVAELDSFLLSCRVLGRGVEDTLLTFLAGRARARGARALLGRYIPTAKNGQTAAFYPAHGFQPAPGDSGGALFRLCLESAAAPDAPALSPAAPGDLPA